MPALRLASMLVAGTALVVLPVGDAALLLAMLVAIDVAGATLLLRWCGVRLAALWPQQTRTVAAIGDPQSLALFRRTVPALRSRKPAAIIEAQVAWRQAGDFRRRKGVVRRQPR